jgi:glucuronate isomerase
MTSFISDNFLLQTETARRLYHDRAADMPIFDYHCHLPPKQIADDEKFENITQAWLYGDHYKWRAMRTNGTPERFCTGNASDWEKFEKWAQTVPHTLRNPLYHWTHLELKRWFGIDELLCPQTAKSIYERCNEQIRNHYSAREFMRKMNVAAVCTTDDPTDSLEHHAKIAADGFEVKVLPTWRPDKAMAVENLDALNQWIDKLASLADMDVFSFESYIRALDIRHAFFHEIGCRISDRGLDRPYAADYTDKEVSAIFDKIRAKQALSTDEAEKFKSAVLHETALLDHSRGWTMQLHIGALRNNSTRMFNALGPDTGFDSIADYPIAESLSKMLNRLDMSDSLPKTILYNLNPRDNELMATMIGNFQDGSIAGKMQYGSGWWFLDQKDGMEKQIEALSNLGLLSRFVGMLTDSRSLLSYPRHEYFRRILCNILGNDAENGLIPRDMDLLGDMVENISFNNAKNYFGIEL